MSGFHAARAPGQSTTAVAVQTLALGIGANTAIFSIVDGVLIRPLPSPQPDQLVALNRSLPRARHPRYQVSAPNFKDFRDQTQVLSGLTAIDRTAPALTGGAALAQTDPLLHRHQPEDRPRPGRQEAHRLHPGRWPLDRGSPGERRRHPRRRERAGRDEDGPGPLRRLDGA